VRTYAYDAVGNMIENTEGGPRTMEYNLSVQMTASIRYGVRTTQVFDSNGNVIRVERVSLPPITLTYDKENREIENKVGGTIVSYTYSGDGLKRSEIVGDNNSDPPSLAVTTLVWDGSDYLQGRA
jgi:hypothetical protein